MGVTGAPHHDGGPPLCMSPPLSPSFPPSLPSPPKGVLKHSISRDSQSSVEILTKRVKKVFKTLQCPLLANIYSWPSEINKILTAFKKSGYKTFLCIL